MTSDLVSLVDHYEAKLKHEVTLYEARRAQIAEMNAPAKLLEFDSQYRATFGVTAKRLMAQFRRDLSELSVKRERKIVYDAVHEVIEKGLINPPVNTPSDKPSAVLPLKAMNEQVQMYMRRHSETLDKLVPLTPSKRRERLTAEANRFSKLEAWRAHDQELSMLFAEFYRHLATSEKPCKRGRKQNETALSPEREFVNCYLPKLRQPLSKFSILLNCRDEGALLHAIATTTYGLNVSEDGLYKAVRNWRRRNNNRVN